MQAVIKLIESLTYGVRLIAVLVAFVIMGGLIVFTAGATYVASEASEELVHTAEELGKDAIRAQVEAERNRELAQEGWGYGSASGVDDYDRYEELDRRERDDGGWGDE
ncbi:MAG: hypothetical protein AAF494_04425 [Pseudomonadota bacterium]